MRHLANLSREAAALYPDQLRTLREADLTERKERRSSSTWGNLDESKKVAAEDEARRLKAFREKSERLKALRMAMLANRGPSCLAEAGTDAQN